MRERGLKHLHQKANRRANESLPVRERGLKHTEAGGIHGLTEVAPRAGAWIEALMGYPSGAVRVSLPVRERGLKP